MRCSTLPPDFRPCSILHLDEWRERHWMAWPRDWGALDCKHNSTGFTQGRSTKRACFWIQTSVFSSLRLLDIASTWLFSKGESAQNVSIIGWIEWICVKITCFIEGIFSAQNSIVFAVFPLPKPPRLWAGPTRGDRAHVLRSFCGRDIFMGT